MRKKSLSLVILVLLFVVGQKSVLASQTITFSVRINPLVVEISAPTEVDKGQKFIVEAVVSNRGDGTIRKASAMLELPDELVLRKKRKAKKLGKIRPGQSKTASWRVRAKNLGDARLKVEATGLDAISKESFSASDTMLVTVREPTPRKIHWFKRFKIQWKFWSSPARSDH